MQNILSNQVKHSQSIKAKSSITIQEFIMEPFKSALIGFISFMLLLIATNVFGFIVGMNDMISLTLVDLLLSSIGFVMVFVYKIMEKYNS